jgi:hypothetical protein
VEPAAFFRPYSSQFKSGNSCHVYIQTPTHVGRTFVNLFPKSLNSMGGSGAAVNAAAILLVCAWIRRAMMQAPYLDLTSEPFQPELWAAERFTTDMATTVGFERVGVVPESIRSINPFVGGGFREPKRDPDVPRGVTPFEVTLPVSAHAIQKRIAGAT